MKLTRRTCLKAAGVSLALPVFESMNPVRVQVHGAAASTDHPKRMVTICTTLGLHAPSLFPEQTGADFPSTAYLEPLDDYRDQFTLFSGLSHPDQSGADGHSSQMTWLTAARHPGLGGFRNSISLDQYVKEKLGYVTRFPSLTLGTSNGSQSYTRSGVMIPAESRPSALFEKLFLQGRPRELKKQRQNLKDGKSILDSLTWQAKSLKQGISSADGRKLEQYLDSIRRTENQFTEADAWLDRPKPKVDADQPQDISDEKDTIGRMQLLMQLVPLILESDSTRMISIVVQGRNDVPPVEGVSIDHHNLSHHGQDEDKIAQLQRIELELMHSFGELLSGLRSTREGDSTLLEQTMVLFGSNLGNANSHDWRNLPIIAAGGGFHHGRYIAYDKDNNTPLSNLFLSMLHNMSIETESFGTSTGTLSW